MMGVINLVFNAILNGTPLMFGTMGESLTEKSGNLNLGVEGMMYMGGAFGLAGAFYYEKLTGGGSGILAVLIAIACSFLAGAIGALIYSFITITLRANQNVTGLALAIFGTGIGQFVGEYMRNVEGGYVAVSNELKNFFQASPFPRFLQDIPVVGKLIFGHNVFVYLGVILAVLMAFYINRTRYGLNLRATGESPATADAAGINVIKYKYLATVIGGGISAIGGMVYIMTIAGCVWNHEGLSGEGWLAVALVIFCLWRPLNTIWGSALFGALIIMYLRVHLPIPSEIYKILPYVVTVAVLVFTSLRKKKENQPPESLGLSYFREDR
ncbi:MAG: ABC transporter permease [Oscillospiraceae bacterium]|nr:ABC transporter permease [Oscillospiraceae bacterium]